MHRRMRIGIGGLLTVGLAVAGSSVAPAQETALSGAWTLNAPEGDWVSAGRDYGLQRYSPLKQITTANVAIAMLVMRRRSIAVIMQRGDEARKARPRIRASRTTCLCRRELPATRFLHRPGPSSRAAPGSDPGERTHELRRQGGPSCA